jgi:hypothetical protein
VELGIISYRGLEPSTQREGNFQNKTKMRITHTPFKTKTRAIGSDVAMTLALISALQKPNKSGFSKLQKLAKTLTKRFL